MPTNTTLASSNPSNSQKEVIASQPVATTSTIEYAGFVVRLAALVIDNFVIAGTLSSIFILLFGIQANILANIASIVTFVFFVTRFGATPGKMFLGLKIISNTGSNPSVMAAILREIVGKLLSGLVFGFGYFWVMFDKEKQGWHDKIAGTHVVVTKPLTGFRKFLVGFIFFIVILFPILLILAAVVLIAINPAAQIQKGRGL